MNAEQCRAAAIRRLRRERDWTLREAAVLFGRDIATLSRWESGRHAPPSASRIAEVFGVTRDAVFAVCEHCEYQPPAGYMCLTCGTTGKEEHDV